MKDLLDVEDLKESSIQDLDLKDLEVQETDKMVQMVLEKICPCVEEEEVAEEEATVVAEVVDQMKETGEEIDQNSKMKMECNHYQATEGAEVKEAAAEVNSHSEQEVVISLKEVVEEEDLMDHQMKIVDSEEAEDVKMDSEAEVKMEVSGAEVAVGEAMETEVTSAVPIEEIEEEEEVALTVKEVVTEMITEEGEMKNKEDTRLREELVEATQTNLKTPNEFINTEYHSQKSTIKLYDI